MMYRGTKTAPVENGAVRLPEGFAGRGEGNLCAWREADECGRRIVCMPPAGFDEMSDEELSFLASVLAEESIPRGLIEIASGSFRHLAAERRHVSLAGDDLLAVPSDLLSWVRIGDSATVCGVGATFEIWDAGVFDRVMESILEEDFPEEDRLGLAGWSDFEAVGIPVGKSPIEMTDEQVMHVLAQARGRVNALVAEKGVLCRDDLVALFGWPA